MSKKEHLEQEDVTLNEQADLQEATETDSAAENPAYTDAAGSPENELAALKAQYDELKDKFLRQFAEFENYKKRTLKEKIDLMKSAAQDTMSALLPVLDDFDRAGKNENFSEGVQLVHSKLLHILKQKGLEAMDSTGRPFDPELHEAVTEIPAPTEDMKGKVIDTIEKGFKLGDKIIRFAKVVVGK
jgi:molecular chaperone GrpE